MIEEQVRRMLASKANEFEMSDAVPERLVTASRGVRPQIRRRAGIALAVAAAVALGVVGITRFVEPSNLPTGVTGSEIREDLMTLVDREVPVSAQGDEGSQPASREALQRHVECMRSQGFDLPDPTLRGGAWSIQVDPATVDVHSRVWRTAAFVTCPLPGSRLTRDADLVLGFPRPEVEAFARCMRDRGFALPPPFFDRRGEALFELRRLTVDFNSPDWRAAVFVDCGPGAPRR